MTKEKRLKIVPVCRICSHKKMCRWFPEVPADFIVKKKNKGALQIALETLFAEHCYWYERRKGEI